MITVIITAAGNSLRSGLAQNKALFLLDNGLSVLKTATLPFDQNERITKIIYTANKTDFDAFQQIAGTNQTTTDVVLGGNTRYHSVLNALKMVTTPLVLIHDGARPFVDAKTIDDCIDAVLSFGSGIVSNYPTDTIAETDDDGNIITSSRKNKLLIKTPQGFHTQDILKAYLSVENPEDFTDDSGIYSKYIKRAHAIIGNEGNIKLTHPLDLEKHSLQRMGTGYDLHRLVDGRKLILGGIEIPHDKGLLGHSDADVLTHAIMDALLSALSLRDIGYHFSDSDARFKDISSMILLEEVLKMLDEKGYVPYNISAVIMAQKPKLSPFVPQITENLAKALNLPTERIGITCTTTESVGLVGREEAIAVHSTCAINKRILNLK